jgi:hypothetical protein
MSYTNSREKFEQVFRETVVPAIMEDVKKTGIDQKAYDWLEQVWESIPPSPDCN